MQQLSAWVTRSDWPQILAAYARCVRITREQTQVYPVNPDLFVVEAEKTLYATLKAAFPETASVSTSVDDFLTAFLPLVPVIADFFVKVMVMAEECSLRENRLGLLQNLVSRARGLADFSKLEGF